MVSTCFYTLKLASKPLVFLGTEELILIFSRRKEKLSPKYLGLVAHIHLSAIFPIVPRAE
jgi:hypothetical protein